MEQIQITTTLGMTMISEDGTTFKDVENARIIAGGLVQTQEVAEIPAKLWRMGRRGGAAVWLAAQKFTPTRITSYLFRTSGAHTADRIHVSCHRTQKTMLVSPTTSVAGMMFKVVAAATTTVAGLEILDLVVIHPSAVRVAILTGAVDLLALTSPTA